MPEELSLDQLATAALDYHSKKDYSAAIAIYEKLGINHTSDEALKNGFWEALVEKGCQLFNEEKNFVQAQEAWEKALNLEIESAVLFFNLALASMQLKEEEKAIGYLEKALNLDPVHIDAYNNLGYIHQNRQDYDRAAEVYERSLQYLPDNAYALRNLALIRKYKGDQEAAIEMLTKATVAEPGNARNYQELGSIYDSRKEFESAIRCYEKAMELDSSLTSLLHTIGIIYYNQKNNEKAIDYYTSYLQHHPNDKYALRNTGLAFQSKGEREKAVDYYEKALEADPAYADVYNDLALVAKADKNYTKAITYHEKALEHDPAHTYSLSNLRWLYRRQGETDKIIRRYEKAIDLKPDAVDVYIQLGHIYTEEKKDFDKALAYYQKAAEHSPEHVIALSSLGSAYFNKRQFEDAVRFFEKVLTIDAKDFYATKMMAMCFENQQKTELAEQQYLKLVEQFPDNMDAFSSLAFFYHSNYRYEKNEMAEEQFRRAIDIAKTDKNKSPNPELATACFDLGNFYLDHLNYLDAVEQFEKALEADQQYVYALHNKAWIYEKLGQYKRARALWHKAVELYTEAINQIEDPALAEKYFYQAAVLNDYAVDTRIRWPYAEIESNLQTAVKIDPANTYFRLHLLKFYLKRKQELESERLKAEVKDEIHQLHIKLLHEYRVSTERLKKRIDSQKETPLPLRNKTFHLELGEFYLAMEQYKEAAVEFEEAIKIDADFKSAYINLGVAFSKLEDYEAAIKCFKKALSYDPDELNVQSNLADAYLKSGKLNLAEEYYKKILQVTPCHQDALLGLGEYYKLVADQLMADGKLSDAEEFLKKAEKTYNEILEIENGENPSSKKLSLVELGGLYYSIGYVKVRLFEMKGGFSFRIRRQVYGSGYLKTALSFFEKIDGGHPNYYKAQTAIQKIKKQLSLDTDKARKMAPLAVFLLSFIVFLAIQVCFWVGRPVSKDVFFINRGSMLSFLSQNKSLDSLSSRLISLSEKPFDSQKEVEEKLLKLTPKNIPLAEEMGDRVIEKKSLFDFKPIDSGAYAALTFGSLIFMVIGIYLAEISKLKVGSIELEKSTADTISTSLSLGISK